MGTAQFGYLLKELRLGRNLTLRAFSRLTGYDASNISKIERGISTPPPAVTLKSWAKHLGLEPGSNEYHNFLETAELTKGKLPENTPDEVRNTLLPALLRSDRSKPLTKEDYERLVRLLNR